MSGRNFCTKALMTMSVEAVLDTLMHLVATFSEPFIVPSFWK